MSDEDWQKCCNDWESDKIDIRRKSEDPLRLTEQQQTIIYNLRKQLEVQEQLLRDSEKNRSDLAARVLELEFAAIKYQSDKSERDRFDRHKSLSGKPFQCNCGGCELFRLVMKDKVNDDIFRGRAPHRVKGNQDANGADG